MSYMAIEHKQWTVNLLEYLHTIKEKSMIWFSCLIKIGYL